MRSSSVVMKRPGACSSRAVRRRNREQREIRANLKRYRRGTHRAVAPAETFARFARHARALGITRIADVTGLDYLGLPVFMAVRPNARSLSVCQGKGLDHD